MRSIAWLVAFVAVLVLADPLLAADHPEGGEGGKLDFLGLKRYDLGIYTLIVFGLLLVVLSKYAWPHIAEGLKKREAAILGARDEAQKELQAAQVYLADAKKKLDEAAQEARAIVEKARLDGDALRAREKEAGEKEVAEARERQLREIQSAKDSALDEIYKQAVELATILSAKTLQRQITPDDHRRLIAESLTELKKTAKTTA